ncbi:acyltransferase family protein [Vibrio sp. Of7-15]|uniref:acyltransferase family protein n=1 Tax=Vibrio sp. Of7-15 TaxID=2724879 RepID=UPI001EF30E7E|nr:acyltransferase family protein [Vibrio sp. Of7-15]MCG7496847.1 acyltransferase family protein [Vibrio sp. Of7-15]
MRVEKVDIAKGIGIICIIISHCFISGTPLHKWLYSFHIPLFFYMSGLFYKERSTNELIKTRFNTLIKPYFFFAITSLSLYFFIGYFSHSINITTDDSINKWVGIFYANGYDKWMFNITLWFLPCLFFLENIYNLIYRKTPRRYVELIIVIVVLIGYQMSFYPYIYLPISADVAFVALLFYHMGNVTKKHTLSDNSFGLISFLVFLGISLFLIEYSELVNMSHREYGNLLMLYIQGVIGVCMVISLSNFIKKSSVLSFFGQNSLIILGTHTIIISLFMGLLPKIGINYSSEIGKTIQSFILCITVLPIVIFILNYKFSFFLGKEKKIN